jgi:hypothetical protein
MCVVEVNKVRDLIEDDDGGLKPTVASHTCRAMKALESSCILI